MKILWRFQLTCGKVALKKRALSLSEVYINMMQTFWKKVHRIIIHLLELGRGTYLELSRCLPDWSTGYTAACSDPSSRRVSLLGRPPLPRGSWVPDRRFQEPAGPEEQRWRRLTTGNRFARVSEQMHVDHTLCSRQLFKENHLTFQHVSLQR